MQQQQREYEIVYQITGADANTVQGLINAVNAAYHEKNPKKRKANLNYAYDIAQDLTARLLAANVISCISESGLCS